MPLTIAIMLSRTLLTPQGDGNLKLGSLGELSFNVRPALSLPRKGTETRTFASSLFIQNSLSRTLLTPQGDGNCTTVSSTTSTLLRSRTLLTPQGDGNIRLTILPAEA